jgi:hypothetical protein
MWLDKVLKQDTQEGKRDHMPTTSSTIGQRALALGLMTALSSKSRPQPKVRKKKFSVQKENAWIYSSKGSLSPDCVPMRMQQG